MGALAGLKVVEMVAIGPCPLAGQLLADHGADVIVVDRASGLDLSKDVTRRGKCSIALNLKNDRGIDAFMELLSKSDVLIEGFRPGVMERLGIGPAQCLKENPSLIYGRMTGWGQSGPMSQMAGHDINYLALTGYLHAIGKAGEPPVPPLNLVADYGGGTMFLLFGILSALFQRHQSGKGQVVDAAMIDGVPAMMGLVHTEIARGTWINERESNRLDGAAPFYRCYATADEKFVSVGALEAQFFAELISKLDLDTAWCERQWDRCKWPELIELLGVKFSGKSRDDWAELFDGSDACVVPVLDFFEAANHPHNKDRDSFVRPDGVLQSNIAPRLSGNKFDTPAMSQLSGAEGKAILSGLGIGDEVIEELQKAAVLL